ncbi:MAG TPA: GNAT family N-acetyltransferase [Saprospiraceae bacterium]|nr:GNAT family N-acetyltransferase [Saprospiraceae bacterium]
MFLRPYRPADKRMIQQLFYETVHKINAGDYTFQQLQAWAPEQPDRETWILLDQQYCYIVEYQRQIVGFASMTKEGSLDFLYVHKDFQNKGIASNLLKQMERIARKFNLDKIVTASSLTAKGFFTSKGFLVTNETEIIIKGVALLKLQMEKPLFNTRQNKP